MSVTVVLLCNEVHCHCARTHTSTASVALSLKTDAEEIFGELDIRRCWMSWIWAVWVALSEFVALSTFWQKSLVQKDLHESLLYNVTYDGGSKKNFGII